MRDRGRERTFVERLQSGVGRRVRYWWERLARGGPDCPAEAALDWLLQTLDACPIELRVLCAETLLEYGCADVVAGWERTHGIAAAEEGDCLATELDAIEEAIEHRRGGEGLRSVDLARAAAVWYRLGRSELADRAFCTLERRQTAAGDFSSPNSGREAVAEGVLAVKYYLDAAQKRVSAAFDAHGLALPHEISPNDGRTIAVCDWAADLSSPAAVADVGCGSGRFLTHLAEHFPNARLTGIDPSPVLLDKLPGGIDRRKGTLLRTGLTDATFDGAFAVESLEHCLVPGRGVAELCRIVRPGGHVLIIDKNRRKQALSEHEPWERWFTPEELRGWLEPLCDEIRIRPIPHGASHKDGELFLAASGRRR